LVDYYRAVLNSDRYPRSAYDTLIHILTIRTLKATTRHMPAGTPTVSFTGLSVAESLPLMRWRARYAEMSFEPYGVALARSAATRLGIRAVRYYDAGAGRPAPGGDVWLTQSMGQRTDWRQERESRARGDLDLSSLSGDDFIAICFHPGEAQKITALTGVRAVSVFSGD